MLKNKIWLGIILSIILLIFSINGFTTDYKYTQESGAGFFVGTADKADALEDTNEMRQIIDDFGALLVHSKRDDLYPKDGTTGGTLAIPNSALVSFATGTKGDLFYCSAANVWIKLNIGTDNQILVVATDALNFETASSDLLSDVAVIAMLDENEAITGAWTVTGSIGGVDTTEFGYLADISAFGGSIIDDADEATFKATVNLEIGTDVLAYQVIGIADDNLVEIDDADAAVDDYCKLTANGIVGRNYTEVKTDLGIDLSLYYLKTAIDELSEVETIYVKDIIDSDELATALTDYYLKTAIDTIGEVETIWVKDITDSDELASALAGYYLKTAIDTQGEVETIWGVSLANDSELHTILTLGTASGLSLDGQELSLAVADTDTTGALSDTDWDTFNNKLSNITGESIGDLGDVDLTDIANLKILKYNSTSGNWECEDETGGGASTFVELTDTPASYTGQAGLYAKVNAGETALEFGTPAGGVDTSGTPEALDIARFTDVDTIEGVNYTELKTALALSSDDLSDVASIAMLDENEIVTVCWYFHDIVYQEYESDLSTYYPQWGFIRRRDGDPTYIVTTGDILGATTFSGGYNEDPLNGLGAVIRGVAEGTFASGDYPTRLEFLTVPNSSSTLTLRMAIDNAGNIKMGDGAWTNYVNISNLGVLTLEGTANIEGVDATELSYLDGVTSDIQTQIDAKKGKNYYSALGSDHTYSNNADTDSQPVGEAVAFGDLLYPDWTAGEWLKADADLAAKMPGLRIALESKTDGQTCLMLVKGYIRDDDAFEFAGSMVYASVTPGAMSSTAPTETGDQVQRVGVAKSADILFFNPSIDVGEI